VIPLIGFERAPGGLSAGGAEHPVAAFLGDLIRAPGQILASGVLAGQASTGAPIPCGLPARQEDCFPVVCVQTCG